MPPAAKQLRLEYFYREMRRKTDVLMEAGQAGRRKVELRRGKSRLLLQVWTGSGAGTSSFSPRHDHERGSRPRRAAFS